MTRTLALSLALALAAPAAAQAPRPSAAPVAADLAAVLAKVEKKTPVNEADVIVYLKAVEDDPANAKFTWEHIITRIHEHFYSHDTRGPLGWFLFENGASNEGYGGVKLAMPVPYLMLNPAGQEVDVKHAYAGARALVARDNYPIAGDVNSWLWGKANTGWGDSAQQVGMKSAGFLQHFLGQVVQPIGRGAEWRDDGAKRFWADWKPEDQIRGNDMGMRLLNWLARNRTKKLSDAFAAVFEEYRKEGTPPPTVDPYANMYPRPVPVPGPPPPAR